ncbi:MAG: IS21 family transposase [Burkholderiaceae bacterium]|nr:IS21 family transposase [Burkholderiaceae bacterium]
MKSKQIADSVRTLRAQGHSLHEISRLLRLSRNTVRRMLRERQAPAAPPTPQAAVQQRLKAVYARAQGNAVRMAQILASEDDMELPYSTLTRWVRQAELRAAPKRSGEYHFAPGQEMQHDTSPHRLTIGGKTLTAQCAALTLAYSRRLFVRYYLRFTRLEAKHFLLRAAQFMDGACPRCVIDNTSVMVVGGAGADAVFAPEMEAFAATLGFKFMAHRVNDPNRKSRIERPFLWVQTNFLPGRSFADLEDLNAQALRWCIEVANAKPKRTLGQSPEAAYALERPTLRRLPAVLPPVYEVLERVVDLYGFVSVDTVRYSVPERLVGKTVTVYKHYERVDIHHRGVVAASHERVIGERDVRRTLPGHHTVAQRTPREPALAEQLLRGEHEVLQRYADALKLHHHHGRGVRALHRLVQIKRTYPREPFLAAVAQALKFGLFDLTRLEHLVLRHVAGDFFTLGDDDGDDDA